MEIKVSFEQHEYISAGVDRDVIKATIRESGWFTSYENFSSIKKGSTSSLKVPKMMQDNEFTRLLLETSEVLKDVTNALVISNWALN